MFCITSLVKSLKALISTTAPTKQTAVEVTQEISTKYENVPPMSPPGRPIEQPIDVIKAENEFGISFFRDFSHVISIDGQPHMVFTARFQHSPQYIRLVSCPQTIRVSDIAREDPNILRYKLDGVVGRMPKSVWDELGDSYNINKSEWLVISDGQKVF
ncbi:hypothetical protein AnigIFM59636_002190 [Aspergillus niger]|nr:hypothetical protein AnigIFM59636_002190 [Aspergillus niger]